MTRPSIQLTPGDIQAIEASARAASAAVAHLRPSHLTGVAPRAACGHLVVTCRDGCTARMEFSAA